MIKGTVSKIDAISVKTCENLVNQVNQILDFMYTKALICVMMQFPRDRNAFGMGKNGD